MSVVLEKSVSRYWGVQIRAMIEVATRAPFGKGSHTITDPQVRSTWELDASQTSFHGDDRDRMLASILLQVKNDLGIDGQTGIAAKPYEMLIYEPGDFFLPHRDSEKEPGMFGTLVITKRRPHTNEIWRNGRKM